MRIIAAPDSFKGRLSSAAAAQAIEHGVHAVFPEAEVIKVPIADGGEGTVDALISGGRGQLMQTTVENPLGQPVQAKWGLLKNADSYTAVIEMAEASGLLLIPEDKRDIRRAGTYGTGQLIRAALDQGARRIIIGIGGSATNDGGAGMAQALGAGLLDSEGHALAHGGAALALLDRIELQDLDPRLKETEILIASDVNNPLCGPKGASAVYGPQKGASPEIVQELDAALFHYNTIARRDIGIDANGIAGSGAAGGLGAGLMLFTNGRMCNGIQLILETIAFEKLLTDVSLVITGEGHTDAQTAHGKAPVGIARLAKKQQIPVLCLSGALGSDADEVLTQGIDAIAATPCSPISLEKCISQAEALLTQAAARSMQLIKIGLQMKN